VFNAVISDVVGIDSDQQSLGAGRLRSTVLDFNSFALLRPPRRLYDRRCLSVCLLATLRKNFRTDLHGLFTEVWQWASQETTKLWWRSGSRILIRISIRSATVVRRALAEVCTVQVLLFFQLRLRAYTKYFVVLDKPHSRRISQNL